MDDNSRYQVANQLEENLRVELLDKLNAEFEQELNAFLRSQNHSDLGRLKGFLELNEKKAQRFVDGAVRIRSDIIQRFPSMTEDSEFLRFQSDMEHHVEIVLKRRPRNVKVPATAMESADKRTAQRIEVLKSQVKRKVRILRSESSLPLLPGTVQNISTGEGSIVVVGDVTASNLSVGVRSEASQVQAATRINNPNTPE